MAIPILYVHHAGTFGGASRSLLDLIKAFPDHEIEAHLVTQRGKVAQLARDDGMKVLESCGIAQFDHTRYGYYRGRRWLLLLREFAYLAPTLLALLKARHRWPDTKLVHINEVTMLPAMLVARILFRCPIVVHVRSVQHPNARSLRTRLMLRLLRHTDAVIAIDHTVRRSLPEDLPCEVIHNGLSVTWSDPPPRASNAPLRIGMVGNLLALKGVDDFIEAARICKSRGIQAKFVIFGGNTRRHSGFAGWLLGVTGFARDIERDLRNAIRRNGMEEMVELAGFDSDLNKVYGSMDILCFPSHLDAPGRPVFEAAFWRVPSIVAVRNPTQDTLLPGETGLAIAAHDPLAIADAVAQFSANPAEIERMGKNAQRLAMENFDAQRNARMVLSVYHRALSNAGVTRSCAS